MNKSDLAAPGPRVSCALQMEKWAALGMYAALVANIPARHAWPAGGCAAYAGQLWERGQLQFLLGPDGRFCGFVVTASAALELGWPAQPIDVAAPAVGRTLRILDVHCAHGLAMQCWFALRSYWVQGGVLRIEFARGGRAMRKRPVRGGRREGLTAVAEVHGAAVGGFAALMELIVPNSPLARLPMSRLLASYTRAVLRDQMQLFRDSDGKPAAVLLWSLASIGSDAGMQMADLLQLPEHAWEGEQGIPTFRIWLTRRPVVRSEAEEFLSARFAQTETFALLVHDDVNATRRPRLLDRAAMLARLCGAIAD